MSKLKYPICEEGAYCSPHLKYADDYAHKSKNSVIIMCRVNPSLNFFHWQIIDYIINDKRIIRIPKGKYQNDEWITDGTKNSIRPYRLLYKLNS